MAGLQGGLMLKAETLTERQQILKQILLDRQQQIKNLHYPAEATTQAPLLAIRREALERVGESLNKIDDGYGDCESCGGEISVSRLQANPFNTLCHNCFRPTIDKQR